MSLNFAANGDLVDFGTVASTDAGTVLAWIYPTNSVERQTIVYFSIPGDQINSIDLSLNFRGDLAGDPLAASRNRTSAYLSVAASSANFSAWALDKWVFVGFVYDPAAADSAQRLLVGDLTSLAAEPSAYTTQTAGSGTVINSSSNTFRVGNSIADTTREFRGQVGWASYFNRVLTNEEIWLQQRKPRAINGCVLFTHLGIPNGVGTQISYAPGGHTGSVTGATLADHVPLGPLFSFDATLPYAIAVADNIVPLLIHRARLAQQAIAF